MVYRYRLTSSAARELEHEIDYSARHWGKRHAKSYRSGLFTLIRQIANKPFSYPERADVGAGYRLVRYKGNYIIYAVNEAEHCVEIIAFPSVHRYFSNT